MTVPGPPEPARSEPDGGRVELSRLDLCAELAAAAAELRHHLLRGDRDVANLLGAWIDTLLDEWNRRRD